MVKNGTTLTEMAAEIGADRYIKSQEENEKLRQHVAGLRADRDALAEMNCEMRDLLQWAAREAATGRYGTRLNDLKNKVIVIHQRIDYWLIRNR